MDNNSSCGSLLSKSLVIANAKKYSNTRNSVTLMPYAFHMGPVCTPKGHNLYDSKVDLCQQSASVINTTLQV